ncbi:MAG: glycosyltransferase involved in cell wall biosynthesis [Planctomycetota bacterium]|jgi:glycosyltransferase involved in cell wall biosynthesis
MKKVLVITYYWPPAGGPGVQRWLKFVKYFPENGIEPFVYIPENPHYPLVDTTFTSEIPKETTIIKRPIKEPYGLAKLFSRKNTQKMSSGIITPQQPSLLSKLMLFVRGNLFIPDARVGWLKPSVSFLSKYLVEHNIDTIVTTGPPHSLHLIGMQLKEKLGIRWVADFRDPWTTIHYHTSLRLTKASEKKHKDLERLVLTKADQITVTSPTTKKEFQAITSQPIEVITNGFEEQKFQELSLDKSFSIAHIGSLLTERNPLVLWEALRELKEEHSAFTTDLSLVFAGVVSDAVKDSLEIFGLTEQAEMKGYIPHEDALHLQRSSQLLLLLEMDRPETKAIIPGKLFEYLQARRPIIAIGPEGSDMETILRSTKSGRFFTPLNKPAVKAHILACYNQYLQDDLQSNGASIAHFSRENLTVHMATLLKSL